MTDETLTDSEWKELQDRVGKVARSVAFNWPDTVTPDDIEQDVFMLLLGSPGSLRTILKADSRIAEQMLYKLAVQEAGKAREQYEYFSGQYNYSVEEVRSLLEKNVLTQPVTGFDAGVADLMDALEIMAWEKSTYLDVLLERYVGGTVPDNSSAERKQLNRGVADLTRRMNRVARKRGDHGIRAGRPRP